MDKWWIINDRDHMFGIFILDFTPQQQQCRIVYGKYNARTFWQFFLRQKNFFASMADSAQWGCVICDVFCIMFD